MNTKPLVIFFSKTGNTQVMVQEIERHFSCLAEKIISKKRRTGFWTINNVFDMLFDRDDIAEPLTHDISTYNPLIFASPIWIHKICSPVKTLMKNTHLAGKDVYIFVTHSGNYFEDDEAVIRKQCDARGATLKGIYGILTRPEGEWHPHNTIGAILKGIHTSITKDIPPEEIRKKAAKLLSRIA